MDPNSSRDSGPTQPRELFAYPTKDGRIMVVPNLYEHARRFDTVLLAQQFAAANGAKLTWIVVPL